MTDVRILQHLVLEVLDQGQISRESHQAGETPALS